MEYTIDPDARLVRIAGTGRVTDDELVEFVSSLRRDPSLGPDMDTLSDMREVDARISEEGVARMLEVMEETADRRAAAKAAVVVGTDVAFGMGRMIELYTEERADPVLRIFRDMIAACEWLGIDDGPDGAAETA